MGRVGLRRMDLWKAKNAAHPVPLAVAFTLYEFVMKDGAAPGPSRRTIVRNATVCTNTSPCEERHATPHRKKVSEHDPCLLVRPLTDRPLWHDLFCFLQESGGGDQRLSVFERRICNKKRSRRGAKGNVEERETKRFCRSEVGG